MLRINKTVNGKLERFTDIESNCWINLIDPTEEELAQVLEALPEIEPDFLRAALDEEETSHVDVEEGQTLIIIDIPMEEDWENPNALDNSYFTLPMGILVTEENIITVCLKDTQILRDFEEGKIKNAKTSRRTNFIFQILLRMSARYLYCLKQIDKLSTAMQMRLYRSQRNRELIRLLDLEKSLVYFNTSLKADDVTLEKLLRGRVITLYEEDQDLLEDVLIEIRQAIEMANIYSSILSGMMDAYASVISNNLNVIMKVLTSITILLTVPTIIFSYYGMNVRGLPIPTAWFPIVLALVIIAIVAVLLKKKDLF